jgi:hypothetical protein
VAIDGAGLLPYHQQDGAVVPAVDIAATEHLDCMLYCDLFILVCSNKQAGIIVFWHDCYLHFNCASIYDGAPLKYIVDAVYSMNKEHMIIWHF